MSAFCLPFCSDFLKDPIQVYVGSLDIKASHHITQQIEFLEEHEKTGRMLRILEKIMSEGSRILIFCETKRGADNLTRVLRQDGWPALAIHGDKTQQERDWVLNEFKTGKSPLMIATDVASRGLDVKVSVCVLFACGCACVHIRAPVRVAIAVACVHLSKQQPV